MCVYIYTHTHTVGPKKVFSQPLIVQVLLLKIMKVCNFHHRYTSTMRDIMRKKIQEITL